MPSTAGTLDLVQATSGAMGALRTSNPKSVKVTVGQLYQRLSMVTPAPACCVMPSRPFCLSGFTVALVSSCCGTHPPEEQQSHGSRSAGPRPEKLEAGSS